MTAPNLASSIATVGPEDDLVVKDIYGTTPSNSLSRVSKIMTTAVTDFGNQLKASNLKPADIANIVKYDKGQVGIDVRQASARADQVAGQNISGIFGVNDAVKVKAASNILGLFSLGKAQKITNQAGEAFRIVDGADTTRASGLSRAVGLLLKDTALGEYVDDNAYVGTAMAYLQEAIDLGMVDLIDAIMNKVEANKISKQQLVDNLLLVVLRGDLETLNKIMDWIGPDGVLSKVPLAVTYLLAGYRFPVRSTPDQYPTYRTDLLATLARLKPDWPYVMRNGEQIFNYEVFYRLSAHVKILLLLNDDPTYVIPVLAAPSFPTVGLVSVAKYCYPNMAVWE